jgi:cation:H+ antiporter
MILLSRDGLKVQILHISIYTPLIIILYFVAMRAAFTYERRAVAPPPKIERDDVSLRSAALRYTAAATVVVAAGTWYPSLAATSP